MTTIFHPTDFSPASHVAFRHALAIALALRGTLTIIHTHAGRDGDANWSKYPRVRETLAEWGVVDASVAQSELHGLTGVSVKKIDMQGSATAHQLAGYLEHRERGLVVMATQGRSGLAALLKPSTARELGRIVHHPILLVRDGMKGFVGKNGELTLDRVLVPIDADPDPQLAFDWISLFDQTSGGSVRAVETLHVGGAPLSQPYAAPSLKNGTFEEFIESGDPEAVIADIATRRKSDLIVMSRAGPDSLTERLVGSTTEQVALNAPCPVLTVPEGSYDD